MLCGLSAFTFVFCAELVFRGVLQGIGPGVTRNQLRSRSGDWSTLFDCHANSGGYHPGWLCFVLLRFEGRWIQDSLVRLETLAL